ncbi:MAG: S53 family peptidase [Candidatus Nanopelagicales bacterium]
MSTRRPLASAAVILAMGAVLLIPSSSATASASTSTSSSFGRSHRACNLTTGPIASCDALVVDNVNTGAPMATQAFTYGYTPAQLRAAYGRFGNGHMTIAIVDAYAHPNAAADLAVYRSQFRLGDAVLREYNQSGGPISTVAANVGWGQEQMLDLEMASAICPQCELIYVGANSASIADLGAAVTTARALGAQVISNSYGSREFPGELRADAWSRAASGAAVTASAGDAGYGVQFPAAAAGVIAVGGTSLTLDAKGLRASESVWSGTGSGCSAYVPKPSWQTDTGCTNRTVADVAAVADPRTGVAVYDSYGSTGGANWYVFGGTSVAAPLIAAMFARGAQFSAGEAVPARLYAHAAGLFDVLSGSNGRCFTAHTTALAYLCTAQPGYDGPTGNGTPNGTVDPF